MQDGDEPIACMRIEEDGICFWGCKPNNHRTHLSAPIAGPHRLRKLTLVINASREKVGEQHGGGNVREHGVRKEEQHPAEEDRICSQVRGEPIPRQR